MRHARTLAIVAALFVASSAEASDMGWLSNARDFITRQFTGSYDAINPNGRRKSVGSTIRSEDEILTHHKRKVLAATGMDLQRNVSVAAWAIRQHLNYVALFDFHPCTTDLALNNDLRALMARDNRPEHCDIGGRHSWARLRRMLEARKTLDGDAGLTKLRSGHVQGIEGHTIANPSRRPSGERWEQGVRLGRGKRALAYCVKERDGRGRPTDRFISRNNLYLFGAFEGRFDQVRGISSFATGMAGFRDFAESFDYAAAKVKVEQLFALAITRDATKHVANPETGLPPAGDDDSDDSQPSRADFSDGGPIQLELDPGEDAKFLMGNSPGSQTQEFLRLSIHLSLLSLDIPMNFFDPKYVNYAGGRTSWNQYERSCVDKREEQLSLHNWYTDWRVLRWMLPTSAGGTGELVLPRSMTRDDICYEWVPRGVPWWKPAEELDAELLAAEHGLDNLERIAKRHNLGDVRENLRVNAEIIEFARDELGMNLVIGSKPTPVQIVAGGSSSESDDDA